MKYIIILLLTAFTFLSSGNLNAAGSFKAFQNAAKAQTAPKAAAVKAAKKPADGRTKTGDKIDHSMKGPKGETVYTGSKGGKYYLSKSDAKIYLKN